MKSQTSYQKSAAKLRQRILSGKLRPGQRLPPERELCEILQVSRITVRQALDMLEDERLIVRRHGSGTYVNERPSPVLPLGIDYAGSVREHAPNLRRKLIRLGRANVADFPWAGHELKISETSVIRAVRVDRIDRVPVAWDECVILPEFASSLVRADYARVEFISVWKKKEGVQVSKLHQRVSAREAAGLDCEVLGLSAGAPVLHTVETYETSDGRFAGTFLSHYLPSRIELRSHFDWPSRG